MENITILFVIFLMMAASAFFSGSETALTAASRGFIHHLARKGNKRALSAERLYEDREKLIGGLLFGNNLVNVFASALATGVAVKLVGDAGVIYASLLMTLLLLIFAEVMPKTYAIRNPDRTVLFVVPLVRILIIAASPFVATISFLVRAMFRLSGVAVTGNELGLTAADELRGVLSLHAREGALIKHERDMLGSILDLEEIDVADVMVHRKNMMLIDADLPSAEIVKQMLSSPYTRVPLWRETTENIVGMLHAKDVLRAVMGATDGEAEGAAEIDIDAIATEPWFVPETNNLREQLNAFRARAAHIAVVVDEYGALMGLVTLEDIIEEIVGDIEDEHDIIAPVVQTDRGGRFEIDGSSTIRDLNRQFDWNLPDEEASTLAGLIIHHARIIPDVGQIFTFFGFRFEILRRERNQITMLRVTPPPPSTSDPG